MESTKFQIQEIIIDGKQVAKPNLFVEMTTKKAVLGLELYTLEGDRCKHCRGNLGYAVRDSVKECWVWFCSTDECLSHDKRCSLAIEREKRLREGSKKIQSPFSHMPVRFQNAELSKWDSLREFHDTAIRWLENPVDFLVYTGMPGTGKTFFACACYNWLAKKHGAHSIAWIDSKKFKKRIYNSIEQPGGYFPILEKYVGDYKFLIFDGLEEFSSHSEWQKEVITIFFDMIYENEGKCLVTCGIPINQIGEKISLKLLGKLQAAKSIHIDQDTYLIRSQKGEW